MTYVTQAPYLDTALNRAKALSAVVDLHFVVVVSPESFGQSFLDLTSSPLRTGVFDGREFLRKVLPETMVPYWGGASECHVAVFAGRRTVHPVAMMASQAVCGFLRSSRPDVVHLDDASGRLAWGAWQFGRIPTVVNVHDSAPHPGEGGWRVTLSRKLNYRVADRFVLQSSLGRDLFCLRYGISRQRVDVSLMGVCSALRDWSSPLPTYTGGNRVLFFGRMAPYKGLATLAAAAPMVAKVVPGVEILVAGSPSPGFEVPKSCDLDNGGRFEVRAQHLSTSETASLFARTSLVVLPYTEASQSGVALCAFALGKPVVASEVGGLPEYVRDGENGLLVKPGDAASLAAAIVKTLTNAGLREALEGGVRRRSERDLNWDRVAEQHLRTYRLACGDAT